MLARAALAVLALTGLRAITPLGAHAPRVVTVVAHDYAFTAPDTIPSGATTFRLVNRGPSDHHLMVLAVPAGMSLATFDRLMRADSSDAIASIGGTEGTEGHGDAWATLDLAPGSYVLVCLLPLPDGSGSHRSRGMFHGLTVVPAKHPAPMPHADVVVGMDDYAFAMSDTIAAGRRLVRFENRGKRLHLAVVRRLAPGKTLADLAAWAATRQGPDPSTSIGGVTEMAPGRVTLDRLDLTPGRYVLLCVDDDGTRPKLHYAMGTVREFVAR